MNDNTNNYSYTDPVAKLLTFGDSEIVGAVADWVDYPTRFGLTREHVPELLRMAADPDLNMEDADSAEVWAPVHAWRAIAQLGAIDAAEPLTGLFHLFLDEETGNNDWVADELPLVYSLLGPATLPALGKYLQDATHPSMGRQTAVNAITEIAMDYDDARDEAFALLIYELMHPERNDAFLNGVIVSRLVEEEVEAALPAIEHAFNLDQVDITVSGDWEEIQAEFGLITLTDEQKEAKMLARQEIFMSQMFGGNPAMMEDFKNSLLSSDSANLSSVRPSAKFSKHAKAKKNKRKQAAKSRKVNRKKKK